MSCAKMKCVNNRFEDATLGVSNSEKRAVKLMQLTFACSGQSVNN